MSIIPKGITIYRHVGLGVDHLGFLKFMGFSGKIKLGIISKLFQYVLNNICVKFGAFTTKSTIISQFCLTI